ncbi:hypothetical protein Rumeso_03397 [Rubellimicrobium mesophilum DSM 19309]|uniref:VanZ-like domain-containing protein n=1 Tax=Rubellimicrobium mesophilum DSM 19309 TaxID=442562 RepID=A0A017HMT7_9RHOB|nr:VanZ family protein [Rubellimicrobium mesophilum]EYD75069.1 hypothetical protein Rumeso_03397 [Rubellimicrobium mesophilum DSM 19309]
MKPLTLGAYIDGSLAYLAAVLAVVGAMSLWAATRRMRRGTLLLSGCTYLIVLSQFPLPDRDRLACPLRAAEPSLVPFVPLLGRMARVWETAPNLSHWASQSGFVGAAMNLIVGALIGALLAGYPIRLRTAAGLGLGLSLAVELTQLTGTWGLYPCAYRKFDVDDLILNTVGVALGFWVARRWATGHGPRRGWDTTPEGRCGRA